MSRYPEGEGIEALGDPQSRRTVLTSAMAASGAVAAAVVLTGCQTYGDKDEPAPAPGGNAGGPLAQTGDIPVGGGKIFGEQGVVLTQPVAGTIKAFSAACTHQGCAVASVSGGTINCTCHGSKFKVADGSVAQGPATSPLAERQITVDGTAIRLA